MDHPSARQLARYALGEVTDDEELTLLEDHLMVCDTCQRRAVAVDLIGTEAESDEKLVLHIADSQTAEPAALCGADASRNIVSQALLSGIESHLVCTKCIALLKVGTGEQRYVN